MARWIVKFVLKEEQTMGKCKLTSGCGSKQCCIECPYNNVCNLQCAYMDGYEYCVECPEYEEGK